MKQIDATQLLAVLHGERKAANKQFRRSDPWGNGFKRAIDRAIAHVEGLRDGLVFDAEDQTYRQPEQTEAKP